MNIRKCWKNVMLATAAILWAGCGEDKGNAVSPDTNNPESSASIESGDEPSSSSEEALPEPESSSSYQSVEEACKDTETFNLAVENSNLRCAGGKMDTLYTCCDGSQIPSPKKIYTNCPSSYFETPTDPDTLPSHWVDDTLYTKKGLNERNSRVVAESARLSKEYEAGIIDSLNKTTTYCDDHGGIKSRDTYNKDYYAISESECEKLSNQASEDLYNEIEKDPTILDIVKSCIKDELHYILNPEQPLYGIVSIVGPMNQCSGATTISYPETTEKSGKNAKFVCVDGTVEETEEYAADVKARDEKEAQCRSTVREEFLEGIERCKEVYGGNQASDN